VRRWVTSPPAVTIASIALVVGAQWLIGLRPGTGTAASTDLAESAEWRTWVFLAGFSVALFAVLVVAGVRLIAR
jgi:hypothetical protein